MPRFVSFIVLVVIILLLGALSFKVMANFYVPLFLAAVLVVVFRPLHRWMLYHCSLRRRLAALLTTSSIVFIVLIPLGSLLSRAIAEGYAMISVYMAANQQVSIAYLSENTAAQKTPSVDLSPVKKISAEQSQATASQKSPANVAIPKFNTAQKEPLDPVISQDNALHRFLEQFIESADRLLVEFGLPTLPAEQVHAYVHEKLTRTAASLAYDGVRILISALVGVSIMILALYYFFTDGPEMIKSLMRLSPLDDGYEQELLDKFGDISRAVVLATLLSALVQGLLASVGYYFVGINGVFFLMALTMFMAMVPFLGAALVWLPVCAWIYLSQGRPIPAAMLAGYCVVVVSMVDNVVKPWVLHGRSNLHPLLALLSVVGGVQALGPIGILVGPMLVSLLQALLVMLNKEIAMMGATGEPIISGTELAVTAQEESSLAAINVPQEASSPQEMVSEKKSQLKNRAAGNQSQEEKN